MLNLVIRTWGQLVIEIGKVEHSRTDEEGDVWGIIEP